MLACKSKKCYTLFDANKEDKSSAHHGARIFPSEKQGGLTILIEFDITLTSKDMYRFNMFQTYTGFHGWFSIFVSIVIYIVAGLTYGELEMTYTILYIIFATIFLFYMPFSLWLRSKTVLATNEVLSKPLHYKIDEKGITVSQQEATGELPWEQIYKLVTSKSNVLIYSNRTNAYIIPREQLGDNYQPLKELAEAKLPKYRVKMK